MSTVHVLIGLLNFYGLSKLLYVADVKVTKYINNKFKGTVADYYDFDLVCEFLGFWN